MCVHNMHHNVMGEDFLSYPREQVGLVKAAESGLDFRRLLLASGEGKEVKLKYEV